MSTLSDHESADRDSLADAASDSDPEPSMDPVAREGGSYDFLFAGTEFRSVEAAAVRDLPEDDATTAPLPAPRAADPAPDRSELEEPAPELPEREVSEPEVHKPEVHEPEPCDVREADEAAAGRTVMRDRLPTPATAAPWTPMVAAVVCPTGHLNPPRTAACRICAVPVPPQEPVMAPRPPLGVLRLPSDDTVVVDRGILVGRRPRIDAWSGDGRPDLVQLNDPDGAVSRNHLRIDIDGWQVLVTDLNSTNGTTLALPAAPARPLVPGEATPLESGAVVRLGDSVSFTYEVAAHPQLPLPSVAPPEARDEAESHPAKARWFRRRRHRNR